MCGHVNQTVFNKMQAHVTQTSKPCLDLLLRFQAIITLILATDMARHGEILDSFKQKVDNFDFTNEEHVTCVCIHYVFTLLLLLLSSQTYKRQTCGCSSNIEQASCVYCTCVFYMCTFVFSAEDGLDQVL